MRLASSGAQEAARTGGGACERVAVRSACRPGRGSCAGVRTLNTSRVALQCRTTDVQAWRAFAQAAAHRETAVAGTPVTSAEVTERSARTTTRSSIWDQEAREKILWPPMVAVGAPRGL